MPPMNSLKAKPKKKHKFKDQTAGIMDLVQTPNTYSAWHPEHADKSMAKEAKSELLAAEKAFDADGDGDFFFLQVKRATMKRRAGAKLLLYDAEPNAPGDPALASLVLEQYARSLDSAPLLQLARMRLDSNRLEGLWHRIRAADVETDGAQHEATSVQWCRDFKKDSMELGRKARLQQEHSAAALLEVQVQQTVLTEEISASEQMLASFERTSKSLQSLLTKSQQAFDGTTSVLGELQQSAKQVAVTRGVGSGDGAAPPAEIDDMHEKLGRADGFAAASAQELQDIIKAALTKRTDTERARRTNLDKLQAQSQVLKKKRASILSNSSAQQASWQQSKAMRSRFEQMCAWTLDGAQARNQREIGESSAIHVALAVLGAH